MTSRELRGARGGKIKLTLTHLFVFQKVCGRTSFVGHPKGDAVQMCSSPLFMQRVRPVTIESRAAIKLHSESIVKRDVANTLYKRPLESAISHTRDERNRSFEVGGRDLCCNFCETLCHFKEDHVMRYPLLLSDIDVQLPMTLRGALNDKSPKTRSNKTMPASDPKQI